MKREECLAQYTRDRNLHGADLREADLRGADLRGADLREAKYLETFVLSPDGEFTAYKKAYYSPDGGVYPCLITLLIQGRRINKPGSRKCRTSRAKVVAISDGLTAAFAGYDHSFIYTLNEIVSVPDFDDDIREECSRGIHYFITKKEAEDYE